MSAVELMSGKEPKKELMKVFEETQMRMIQVAEESDMPLPAKANSKASSYLNIYKYWNDFIIKGKLPSYRWVVENIFNTGDVGAGIFSACKELCIFQFFSREFIDFLTETIKNIQANKIVEIGAGDGLLSHFLREKGIDIHPTDDHSRDDIEHPERVEKLSHKEALKKYNPDLVIINWEEYTFDYAVDVLKYPSVKYVIWIGEYNGGCTGSEKLWNYKNKDTDNPYCLARTDSMMFGNSVHKHTGVWIFYPKKTT